MSKGQTGSDDSGWKRGEKGFGKDKTNDILKESYQKDLLEVEAVGQRASVGDGSKLKQRGY